MHTSHNQIEQNKDLHSNYIFHVLAATIPRFSMLEIACNYLQVQAK